MLGHEPPISPFSTTATRCPHRASSQAMYLPASPPPTTTFWKHSRLLIRLSSQSKFVNLQNSMAGDPATACAILSPLFPNCGIPRCCTQHAQPTPPRGDWQQFASSHISADHLAFTVLLLPSLAPPMISRQFNFSVLLEIARLTPGGPLCRLATLKKISA